jgi:hypothetical protein
MGYETGEQALLPKSSFCIAAHRLNSELNLRPDLGFTIIV